MAQYIKKFQEGGSPKLIKTQTNQYSATDVLDVAQSEDSKKDFLKRYGFKKKEQEAALNAYDYVLQAINTYGDDNISSFRQLENLEWEGKGLSRDPYVSKAIGYIKYQIMDKMDPYKAPEVEKKEKEKFDSDKDLTSYIAQNLYGHSSLTNSDLVSWMELDNDNIDESGNRGNTERLATFIGQLKNYKDKVDTYQDDDYDWDVFKTKSNYLERIQKAIDDLSSIDPTNYDSTQRSKLRDALNSLGLSRLKPMIDVTKLSTDYQQAVAERNQSQVKAARDFLTQYYKDNPNIDVSTMSDDDVIAQAGKIGQTRKQTTDAELAYQDYAKDNYKPKYNIGKHSTVMKNVVYFVKNAIKEDNNFIKNNNNIISGLFDQFASYFNDPKRANVFLHEDFAGFNTTYKLPSGKNFKVKNKSVIAFYLKSLIDNARSNNPNTAIQTTFSKHLIPIIGSDSEFILKQSLTKDGQAWKFNTKTGQFTWISYGGKRTPTLSKLLRDRDFRLVQVGVQTQKYGGIIQSLRNGDVVKYQSAGVLDYINNDDDKNKNVDSTKVDEPIKQLSPSDYTRLSAAAADLTGALAATLVPGYGTAVGTGAGLLATLGNLGADIADDRPLKEILKNAGFGLTADVAGIVPGLGFATKLSKIGRSLRGIFTIGGTAMGLYNLYATAPAAKSGLQKLFTNPGDLTKEELFAISDTFTAMLGGVNMVTGAAKRNAIKNTIKSNKVGESYKITIKKDKKGALDTVDLTKEEYDAINKAQTIQDKNQIIRNRGGEYQNARVLTKQDGTLFDESSLQYTPATDQQYDLSKLPRRNMFNDYSIARWQNQPHEFNLNPYNRYYNLNKKLGGKLQIMKSLRNFHTDNSFSSNELSSLKQGGIIKGAGGLVVPEWYNNRYGQKHLNGEDTQKSRNQNANTALLIAHNQYDPQNPSQRDHVWDLYDVFNRNQAYTTRQDAVTSDINTYAESDFKDADLNTFVNEYNKSAQKIRDFWKYGKLNPAETTTYMANDINNDYASHNRLFRKMFANRSTTNKTDDNKDYIIGYQDDIENQMGTNTWKRRMDQYEKEFGDLSTTDKLKRVHYVKGKGWVYKLANGDIGIVSNEDIQALGLQSDGTITTPTTTASDAASDATNTEAQTGTQQQQDSGQQETGEFSSSNDAEISQDEKKGKVQKTLKTIQGFLQDFKPDILATGRLAWDLYNNRMMYNVMRGLRAPLKGQIVEYSPLRNGFDIEQAANEQANEAMAKAGVPKTSDASLNQAIALENQLKSAGIIREGQLRSNEILRRSEDVQRALNNKVYEYNRGVADFNTASLTELSNQWRKMKAGLYNANAQSWDKYLMGLEQRAREAVDERKTLQDDYDKYVVATQASRDPDVIEAYNKYKNLLNDTAKQSQPGYASELYNARYLYEAALQKAKENLYLQYYANRGVRVRDVSSSKKGGTIDDTQVKKRKSDNDRLAKQIIAELRNNSRALENLSRAQLLSIKKMLS